jgi:hypothetical protein
MIRVLRVARRGAMKARVAAGGQLRDLVYAAPEELRSQLRRSQTTKALARACLALRPGPLRDPESATKAALRALARRWHHWQAELTPGRSSSQAGQHGRASAVGPARHWPGHRWAAAGDRWRQPRAAWQ